MTSAIICGGRAYRDRDRVFKVLDRAVERFGLDQIIHGAAGKRDAEGNPTEGADLLAEAWALARGDISVIAVPADWDGFRKLGKVEAAGPSRNALMLKLLFAAPPMRHVIAFPGGSGTDNMVSQASSPAARAAGVAVNRISP